MLVSLGLHGPALMVGTLNMLFWKYTLPIYKHLGLLIVLFLVNMLGWLYN